MKLKKGSAAAKAFMAKIRAKKGTTKKVGDIAKNKNGKPAKRLTKSQKDYNKDVDLYKYFVVKDGIIESGFEYKSDALDLAKEFEPKAIVLSKKQLSNYPELKNFINRNKYTLAGYKKVGSTSKITPNLLMELWFAVHSKESNKYNTIAKKLDNEGVSFSIQNAVSNDATEMRYKKNIDTFEVANRIQKIMQKTPAKKIGSTLNLHKKEIRLGMPPKTTSKSGNGYHKDTKSHNVNIRVVSGIGNVTEKLKTSMEWINFYKEQLQWWKNFKPVEQYEKTGKIDSIKFYTKSLNNEKRHLNEIKKTI